MASSNHQHHQCSLLSVHFILGSKLTCGQAQISDQWPLLLLTWPSVTTWVADVQEPISFNHIFACYHRSPATKTLSALVRDRRAHSLPRSRRTARRGPDNLDTPLRSGPYHRRGYLSSCCTTRSGLPADGFALSRPSLRHGLRHIDSTMSAV